MSDSDRLIWEKLREHRGPFFFVGSGKNAGKTTLLNAVNRVLSGAGRRVGVMTIGHDGEPFDAILGHAKPPVSLLAGNLACLSESMAGRAGPDLRVIGPAGCDTAVGALVLAEARRGTRVEILGPETNKECLRVCEEMGALGAEIVLVDGAFSRRTQIALVDRTALALIISGDIGGALSDIEKWTRHWVELFRLPRVRTTPGDRPSQPGLGKTEDGRALVLRGPLTDEVAEKVLRDGDGLPFHIGDATKVFCTTLYWERLKKNCAGIFVSRSFDLKMIAANPTARCHEGFEPGAFARTIKEAAGDAPVVDVVSGLVLR